MEAGRGIVLFGHGARNPEWAVPFHLVRAEIARQNPDVKVVLGFLELMTPTLSDAIANLAADAVRDILIVPLFISAGSHIKEDLPKLAEAAMGAHPGLNVRIAPPLGDAPEMIAAMAGFALQRLG